MKLSFWFFFFFLLSSCLFSSSSFFLYSFCLFVFWSRIHSDQISEVSIVTPFVQLGYVVMFGLSGKNICQKAADRCPRWLAGSLTRSRSGSSAAQMLPPSAFFKLTVEKLTFHALFCQTLFDLWEHAFIFHSNLTLEICPGGARYSGCR